MEKTDLKAYLEQVHSLELDIYTMDEAKKNLLESKRDVKPKHVFYEPRRRTEKSSFESEKQREKERIWKKIILISAGASFLTFGYGIIPALILIAVTPIAIIPPALKKVELSEREKEKGEIEAEHEKAMCEYRERVKKEEVRFKTEEGEVARYNAALDQEIERIEKSRTHTIRALSKLYGLDIIYPKYRSLIPVTMFCEYIASGRRSVLEGTDGMYDLYENELRMGTIIGELQEVKSVLNRISDKLSAIQRNQYMLYKAVEQGNAIASGISSAVGDLANNTAKLCSNTERIREAAQWTAFNTEAIARRTEAIARIQEYEHTLKYPVFHA